MGTVTTAMTTSFKTEVPQAAHCFAAPAVPTGGVVTNGSFAITSLSSVAAILVGMAVTAAAGVAAGAVVASIDSATQITMSKAGTSTPGAQAITFTGDTFNVALIKPSPTGSYGAATTNYSDVTGNSDEASGTGYTAGGQALSANISPQNSGTTSFWSWSGNPSWTGASFSAIGCLIYNTTKRLGNTANRSVSTHDFGGTQTVASGTFTIVLPTNDASNAILRIT